MSTRSRLFSPIRQWRPGHVLMPKFSHHGHVELSSDPLHILFCGSDDFSAAHLQALHHESVRNPTLIHSISVMVRPGKRTGRGLQMIRHAPLTPVAHGLGLSTYERDTFTGWTLPTIGSKPINLIIAVSFGLFVPPRILRAAQYGGLNVHPSLLPDLAGPAPLHHALLRRRTHTGVTVQTLSETAFDVGTILAQTPPPGVPIPPGCTVAQLHDLLAPRGADMLVQALRQGLHVPPHEDPSESKPPLSLAAAAAMTRSAALRVHAPKIGPADSCVQWADCQAWNARLRGLDGWSAAEMALRARVVGTPWTRLVVARGDDDRPTRGQASGRHGGELPCKRVKIEDVHELPRADWPASVCQLYRQVQTALADESARSEDSGIGASIDGGALSTVEFARGPPRVGGLKESLSQSLLSEDVARVPCFPDGDAVVLPMAGGGCVKVHKIRVEGDTSKPAVVVLRSFVQRASTNGSTAGVDELLRCWVARTEHAHGS